MGVENLVKYAVNLRGKGKSPLIVIVGEMGTGKTTLAMLIKQEIAKKMKGKNINQDLKGSFFHDVESFINGIDNFRDEVIIIDEAGVEAGSDEWWSIFNKALSRAIQTQRYKGHIYILILPHINDLSNKHKKYMNIKVHTMRKGLNRWWMVFQKYWRDDAKGRSEIWVENFFSGLPDKKLMDEYKEIESRNKKRILDDLREDIKRYKDKHERRSIDFSIE